MEKLLAKGAIESSTGGTGFYSTTCVIPKCTGGLHLILNLKWFAHFMHISTFKMPTIRQVWQHIQKGNYVFLLILQMLISILLLLHITIFAVWLTTLNLSMSGFGFLAGFNPWDFHLTKPILLLCHHNGFHVIIYLDDILVLTHSRPTGKRVPFVHSIDLSWIKYQIFPSLNYMSISTFLSHVGIQWTYLSPYHLSNLLRSSSWLMPGYWDQLLWSIG